MPFTPSEGGEPSHEPHTGFVAYPRRSSAPELSAERLLDLFDGYQYTSLLLLVNVVAWLLWLTGVASVEFDWGDRALLTAGLALFVGGASIPIVRKLGRGLGWSGGFHTLMCVLLGLNSVICCGLLGYTLLQTVAANAMRNRYGISFGILGPRRSSVRDRITELAAAEAPREG